MSRPPQANSSCHFNFNFPRSPHGRVSLTQSRRRGAERLLPWPSLRGRYPIYRCLARRRSFSFSQSLLIFTAIFTVMPIEDAWLFWESSCLVSYLVRQLRSFEFRPPGPFFGGPRFASCVSLILISSRLCSAGPHHLWLPVIAYVAKQRGLKSNSAPPVPHDKRGRAISAMEIAHCVNYQLSVLHLRRSSWCFRELKKKS